MKKSFVFFDVIIGRRPYSISIRFHNNPSWFKKDYMEFKKLLGGNLEFPIKDNYPCLNDKYDNAGTLTEHYFFLDLFVAQRIFLNKPVKHVDIASRIDGFVAHVASYREIELLDIRAVESKITNVKFTQLDLMDDINIPDNYCDSISCLHALEHFGLGRYGDPLNPNGHLNGFRNITRMLKKGGRFYFAVPLGPQRIEFNAHRVFSLSYLLKLVNNDYDIESFSYIDKGELHTDVDLTDEMIKSSCGCKFGCAIFILIKK